MRTRTLIVIGALILVWILLVTNCRGMITVNIDSSRMKDRLNELHDALIGAGQLGDAATMLEDESRRFLKAVIRLTPPSGLGQDARQKGESAIERDLMKIFTPVNEEFLNVVGSQFGVTGIDHWLELDGTEPKRLVWDRIDPTGTGMEAFHHANQNRRGRTRNLKRGGNEWYSPYVISFQDFADYLARVKSHVGRRKAAWAISYKSVGGKVQGWIGRHLGGARGACRNDLVPGSTRPSITMLSAAVGVGMDAPIVEQQMEQRRQAIGRRIKLILSGYSRDVKQGMKITRKERRQPAEAI